MHSINQSIIITGSWEDRQRSSIALPDIVWKYLRLESAAKGIPIQDLILQAVIEYYNLKSAS